MTNVNRRLLCAAAFACMLSALALADVPRQLSLQGRLATSSGAFLPGPVDLRVRLYDHPSSPAPVLFDESHAGVTLDNGLFTIQVGSETVGGVPDSALAASEVYLGVAVDGAAELSPRTRLSAAAYSVKSKAAEGLVQPGTLSPVVHVDAAGNVGVGTPTPDPSAILDVASTNRGFMPPRMTTAQRDLIAGPGPGLMIYNVDTNCLDMWVGSTWKQACFDCTFQPPTAGNNGPICEGQTLNLTATTIPGAVYQWSGPNGFSSTNQNPSISNATPAATGPYSVTASLDGCTSNAVTTLATVSAIPSSPTVSNNGPLCAGQTLMLTSDSVPGATYAWTGPNGFTSNDQNPTIANATAAAAGTYTLVITVNGCDSPAAQTTAAVNAIPATPGGISGSTTVTCEQTGVVYSITDVPGATVYTWTVPSGASIAAGQSTAFLTVNFGSSSGNITVTAGNSCGTSAPATLMVTIQSAPGSQTFTATGSGQNGTIQTFTVPACVSSLTIETWGAESGLGYYSGVPSVGTGKGARMRGEFSVTPGEQFKVLVGQKGPNLNSSSEGFAGGGGGTFVTRSDNTPLIIAGGGGAHRAAYNNYPGNWATYMNGTTATNGISTAYAGGSGGSGGGSGTGDSGAGGGGLTGNGGSGSGSNTGGRAFINGGQGGNPHNFPTNQGYGGFGGGGGGGWGGAGGGGGYSGGSGDGNQDSGILMLGGGGGSYNAGNNQSNAAGVRSGNGEVVITW